MLTSSLKMPFDERDIEEALKVYGKTPFFLYDEATYLQRAQSLQRAMSVIGPEFREYFAVKALPNPIVVQGLESVGCGTDCSSPAELVLSESCGLHGERIMFTSNNTTEAEFAAARKLGAIINLDDISHIPALERAGLPDLVCCRYNPGERKNTDSGVGQPKLSKFGSSTEKILEMYRILKSKGVRRFGLHTMIVTDERNMQEHLDTAQMLFELALLIREETGIELEFINFGGGLGVPYHPDQQDIDIDAYARGVKELYEDILVANGLQLEKIYMENGRYITGPAGIYLTKVVNVAQKYLTFVGTDGGMQDFPRPGRLKAYHHISVLGEDTGEAPIPQTITGSLCVGNDVFASDRMLRPLKAGDLLAIHTAGAHAQATGYQYNSRPRCGEVLKRAHSGAMEIIRHPETIQDLFHGIPGYDPRFTRSEEIKFPQEQ